MGWGELVDHRDGPELECGFQDRLDRLAGSDKDHDMPRMGMQDSRAIREFLVQAVMDFRFAGDVAIAFELVARQVADKHLVRLKLPVTPAAAEARRDADRVPDPHADIPTSSIGEMAPEDQLSGFGDLAAGLGY